MTRERLSNGDIESLRRKLKDEGRPMKSGIVIKNGTKYHHSVNQKTGKVTINETT